MTKCVICKIEITEVEPSAEVLEYVRKFNAGMERFRNPLRTTAKEELSKLHIMSHADDKPA
jgi:hypothetical protein